MTDNAMKTADDKQIQLLMLVDDEAIFRRNLARLLTQRGLASLEAENGETCLSMLQSAPADVVILDVKMPGISGLEVLRRIRRAHPDTEVILLTGQASARDGVEGIKSGAFDYLSKPVEIDHLVGKIRQAREKRQRDAQHRREKAFRAKMEKRMAAAERLAAVGTLAAGVAHEINNPLAIIKQSVQWINLRLQKIEEPAVISRADIDRAMGNIERAVERARRITHQLLGSTRQNDDPPAETDLVALIDDALELVAKTASNAGIRIIRNVGADLKTIWSNPTGIRQVITNLMINAIQATEKGGTITISAAAAGTGVELVVADSGTGIPEENLDRIFEPFFTTKPPGEGTGLGMFVIRNILDAIGGTITVDSRLGHGTRFCVRLPESYRNHGD